MSKSQSELSRIESLAIQYHLNGDVSDKLFDEMFHEMCASWILGYVSPDLRILDLGYGEGNISPRLSAAVHRFDVVEGSASLCASARLELGDSCQVHHSLFEDFSPKEPYDLIIATNILEHVDNPSEILSLIHGWLRDGGICLVTVPNAGSIHRRLAVLMGIQSALDELSSRDHLVGHQRVYDLKGVRADVCNAGFVIVEERGFVLKVLPNTLQKTMSPKLLEAFHTISDQIPIDLLANIGLAIRRTDA